MVDIRSRVSAIAGSNVRTRRYSLAVALCAALGMLLAVHARAEPLTHRIVIDQMRFDPPTLTVKRGDRVEWVNKDLFAHTATSTSKAFDSGSIAPNASWRFVAGRAGSYPYLCTFHPTMHGTLNVR
ncbi:cupredoxin family copper-binding protein [Paraburkholderia sp. DGU8]|uniref:cupredoxin domain-containing protein n=1 Tax=Paraburkholderia sp. DGU8 TaxID=3161997 RepID=UPI003467AE4F